LIEPRGHDHVVHLRLAPPASGPFLVVTAETVPPQVGAEVAVTVAPRRIHLFDGPTGCRLE